jgi:hypothetical protein
MRFDFGYGSRIRTKFKTRLIFGIKIKPKFSFKTEKKRMKPIFLKTNGFEKKKVGLGANKKLTNN